MAVINGTNVYNVPVFNAVVVSNAMNIHIKKIAKKRLMIRLLGKTFFAILRKRFFVRIKGSNTRGIIIDDKLILTNYGKSIQTYQLTK